MNDNNESKIRSVSWIKPLFMFFVSVFFLFMGIGILKTSYHLSNPLEFIMSFFSSSLMILISGVGLCYGVVKIYRNVYPSSNEYEHEKE